MRILFVGMGYMIWYMKPAMLPYKNIIADVAGEFTGAKLKANRRKRVGVVLLTISLVYYLF